MFIRGNEVANRGKSTGLIVLAIVVIGVLYVIGTYNSLIHLDQGTQSQWAEVENAYQRRLDLVPNLVATVKGAAAFEKSTYTAVAAVRANAGQVSPSTGAQNDPAKFAQYQKSQDNLSSALSRLMVVVEAYPDLKATENFRDLQAQLEGTENRITVARMRFNEAAQGFNSKRDSFPANVVAGLSSARFHDKIYFKADDQAATAPKVSFQP